MNPFDTPPLQTIFDQLARLRRQWPGRGFSWDPRLACVASSIHVDLTDEALSAAASTFPHQFTTANILSAPSGVRQLADATGGIRPEQVLMSMPPIGSNVVYALWWPWGDDVTVSFRIGMTGPALGREDVQNRFRELFGAAL